jgi:hypothetical protein
LGPNIELDALLKMVEIVVHHLPLSLVVTHHVEQRMCQTNFLERGTEPVRVNYSNMKRNVDAQVRRRKLVGWVLCINS